MRVLILFVTAVLVAACAGRSAPEDAVPAPAVAATGEVPTDVKTVEASELVANEQFCEMRIVTGSIRKQRVCWGRSAGPEEVAGQEQIRDTLQEIERQRSGGGLVIR
jgi:hypothetical protein